MKFDARTISVSLLIALAVGTYDLHYPNYAPDQHIFGTMLLKDKHPDLFTRDFFFGDPANYGHYVPCYRSLAGWVVGDSEGEDLLFRYNLLLFPTLFFFVWGFHRLFFRLTGNAAASWAVTAAAVVSRQSLSVNQFGIGLHDSMVAYKVFLAAVPWILDLTLRRAFHRTDLLVSFFLLGLVSNFHPILGLGFAGILALSLAGVIRPKVIVASTLVSSLSLFVAGFAPYIILYLRHASPVTDKPFTASEFWTAFSTNWGYLPVSLLGLRAFLMDSIFLIVFSLIGWRAVRRNHGSWDATPAPARFFVWFAAAAVFLPVLVSAALQAQSLLLDRPPIIGLEPMRWTAFLYVPLYVLSAHFLSGARAGDIPWGRMSRRTLFIVAVFPLFIQKEFPGRLIFREALIRTGIYSEKRTAAIERDNERRNDLLAVAQWARSTTPVDALFFHPHYDFRFYSQRAVVIGWKDGSMFTRAGSKKTREWLDRAGRVREAIDSKDAQRVFNTAGEMGCDFVILREGEGPQDGIGSPVFQNQTYRVYRVADDAGKS